MSPPDTTLRFMTRFRCIAERCEDTCCGGLRVPLSEASLRRMREGGVLGDGEEASREVIIPNPAGPPAERAFFRMRPDGCCVLFDAERRCSLQRLHGEAAMPDICVTFPRVVWKREERLEVSASLACPEAVRLLLLAEDAVERVPVPPGLVVRPEAARPFPGLPGELYGLHVEALREALRRILLSRGYPLSSRLAALGGGALRMDSLFRGPEAFPGDEAEAEARLKAELQHLETPEALASAHRELAARKESGGPPVLRLLALLRELSVVTRSERFAQLVQAVHTSLGGPEEGQGDGSEAWRLHVERRARLEAAHGARVEQYFRHYLENYLLRYPLTEALGLLPYLHRLSARLATLRLVLVNHPAVGPEASQEALDRAAVECFQLISRNVDLAPGFLTSLQETPEGDRVGRLAEMLAFARFS